MPKSLKLTIGNRQIRLAYAANKVGSAFRCIQSIWGFGSAFCHGPFSDIDLLIVVSSRSSSLAKDAMHAKRLLDAKAPGWRIPIDMLVLTDREMHERPLRDMDQLKPLFARNSISYTNHRSRKCGYHGRVI
jgi:hypothetical protein